jgi:hypothetical protein
MSSINANNQRLADLAEAVIFTDTKGQDHNALVTAVWGPTCVNLLWVSDDTDKKDQYGRQIERNSSVPHVSMAGAHGYYFRFRDEEKKMAQAPIAN